MNLSGGFACGGEDTDHPFTPYFAVVAMALSLTIPHDEKYSTTPDQSPRIFCLTKSFTERFMSPKAMSTPGSASSARFGSPTPFGKTTLQRFHSSPRSRCHTPILRSPANIRSTLGKQNHVLSSCWSSSSFVTLFSFGWNRIRLDKSDRGYLPIPRTGWGEAYLASWNYFWNIVE